MRDEELREIAAVEFEREGLGGFAKDIRRTDTGDKYNRAVLAMLKRLSERTDHAIDALKVVLAHSKDDEITAFAQAGIDLATLGKDGCAQMRGDHK